MLKSLRSECWNLALGRNACHKFRYVFLGIIEELHIWWVALFLMLLNQLTRLVNSFSITCAAKLYQQPATSWWQ